MRKDDEPRQVGQMTREQAQELVLGRANSLFKKIENMIVGDEDGAPKRLKIYEEIGGLILNKDLPVDGTNELVTKIVLCEWFPKSEKLFLAFLKKHHCWSEYWENMGSYIPDVFEEVSYMFPQFGDVVKERFSGFLDDYKKTGNYTASDRFVMNDLFLVEAADFGDNKEKQVIAKSWLAGYFIFGKDVFQDMGLAIPEDKRNGLVSSMLSEYFGIDAKDVREVAQNILGQINGEWRISMIEDCVKNICSSPLVDAKDLSFENLSASKLAEIFKYSRRSARVGYFKAQKTWKEEDRIILRSSLMRHYAKLWFLEKVSESKGSEYFEKFLNSMTEDDFFRELDQHLLESVKELSGKLNINPQEMDNALDQEVPSDEITKEVKVVFKKLEDREKIKKDKAYEAWKRKIEEKEAKEQRDLELALEMLQEPGVRPE